MENIGKHMKYPTQIIYPFVWGLCDCMYIFYN